ncbi:OmpH family outer membrane protein [Magnetovibrio sp. PR-2]|uniref:OmpH family outer membrane protein n=1 Tax=Magnetovibrio sp. PR-2 TaxID=3120356 RepID=UPI002FCE1EA2
MINKTIVHICVAVFCVLMMTPKAQAQNASGAAKSQGVYMAVLDKDIVLDQSKALKNIREQIVKYQTAFKKELDAQKAALDKASKELQRKKNLQTPEQFKAEQDKFAKSVVAWKRKVQQGNIDLAKVRTKATSKIEEVYAAVVSGLAQKNGITIVFDKRATFFAHPNLDITNLVAAELNTRLPAVAVENPWKK